jgi:uncharacterized protein (DUF1015 family)
VAEIRPLRGLRYDPGRFPDLTAVVAPPYDVITPAHAETLHARSPYNVVRLILNREPDRYRSAAATLREWRARGILVEDAAPGLCFYSQTFEVPGLGRRRRDGVIGALRLETFASGRVRPHERTFAAPKTDRLALLRACGANLSPIFGLVSLPGVTLRERLAGALGGPPAVDLTDDLGVRHQVWRVDDAALVAACAGLVRDETVVIADGHHRYETALAYRDEMRRTHPGAGPDAPFEFILAYLANLEEPGVVILPTHRIVRSGTAAAVREVIGGLAHAFAATIHPPAARAAFLDELREGPGLIGCVLPGELVVLRFRGDADRLLAARSPATRRLDVALLHDLVLARLEPAATADLAYTHDEAEAIAAVVRGGAAAFLLHPPTVQEVRAVCLAGDFMPEKSTYFYPKLLDGLVFYSVAV